MSGSTRAFTPTMAVKAEQRKCEAIAERSDDLVRADTDQAEQLNAYLVSAFTNKVSQGAVPGDEVQQYR